MTSFEKAQVGNWADVVADFRRSRASALDKTLRELQAEAADPHSIWTASNSSTNNGALDGGHEVDLATVFGDVTIDLDTKLGALLDHVQDSTPDDKLRFMRIDEHGLHFIEK